MITNTAWPMAVPQLHGSDPDECEGRELRDLARRRGLSVRFFEFFRRRPTVEFVRRGAPDGPPLAAFILARDALAWLVQQEQQR